MTTRRDILFSGTAALSMIAMPAIRASAANKTTLQVAYSPANLSAMYEAVFQAFMAENPDISISARKFAAYNDLLQDNLRAQIDGNLPDVSHDGLNLVRVYADRGLAVPLDGYIAREGDWSAEGYPDSVQRVGRVNEKVYAMPFAVSTPTLFFNLDLVQRAGGDREKLPTDWPEILALARAIDALGGSTSGIYYDYGAGGAFAFQALLFSRGGSLMSPDEKTLLVDGPEGQWAMELLREFGEAGQIDMSRDNARQSFVSGTLGIYMNTSSNLGNFDRNIDGRFQYAMLPIPISSSGRVPAAGNGMVMFSKDDIRRDAAWKYIKFASGPTGQAIMAQLSGYVPVNTRTLEAPKMKEFYDANPNYAVALTQIDNLTAWYLFPGENGVKAIDSLTNAMGEVITLRKKPGEALANASQEIRKLIGL